MAPVKAIKKSMAVRSNGDSYFEFARRTEEEYEEYLGNLARVGELVEMFVDDIQKGVEDYWGNVTTAAEMEKMAV